MKPTTIPYFAVLLVILYGAYNAFQHTEHKNKTAGISKHAPVKKETLQHVRNELARIDSNEYTYRYIINVINHGSNTLHFKPKEIMEEGFVSKEDAPKVACYVLSLADEECPMVPFPKDAAMYYSSNCAGCHGEDGKGLHGTYPNLTQRPLLGVEKRKSFLNRLLKQ